MEARQCASSSRSPIGAIIAIRYAVVGAARALSGKSNSRVVFWIRQGSSLGAFALILLVAVSIWFDNAARLTTSPDSSRPGWQLRRTGW
jgi:hypothetical protein